MPRGGKGKAEASLAPSPYSYGSRQTPDVRYASRQPPDVGSLSTIDGGEGKREDAPLIGDNNERERELKGSEINVLFCGSALLVLVFDL